MTWKNSNNEYKTKLNSCVKKISRIHIQFVKNLYETKYFCNKRTKFTFTHMKRAMNVCLVILITFYLKWNITESENMMKTFHKWPWVSHSLPPFKNQFAYSLNPLSQNNSFTHRNRHPLLKWVGLVLGVSLYFEQQDLL